VINERILKEKQIIDKYYVNKNRFTNVYYIIRDLILELISYFNLINLSQLSKSQKAWEINKNVISNNLYTNVTRKIT